MPMTSNTYSVTVVATDATRRESTKPVTVSVTNVDEPGTVKLTTLAADSWNRSDCFRFRS